MQRWSLRFGFQAIVSLADSVVTRAHLSFLQPLQLFLRGQGLNRQALPQALDGLCQWVQWSFWSTKNKKNHLYPFISILLLLLLFLTRINQLRCPHSVPSKNNTSIGRKKTKHLVLRGARTRMTFSSSSGIQGASSKARRAKEPKLRPSSGTPGAW